MKKLTDIISPIVLKKGSHSDTAQTGSGCFMNVIAYLNGEPQITDQSSCVCVVVRPIAIWLNDFLLDSERQEMIPYIQKAMGSATNDLIEIGRRVGLVVEFSNAQKDLAAKSAKSAKYAEYAKYAAEYAKYAAEYAKYAAEYAKSAAESAAEYAAKSAEYAEEYAEYRKITKKMGFALLDGLLKNDLTHDDGVYIEAKKLAELAIAR